jgi:dolichol kinase
VELERLRKQHSVGEAYRLQCLKTDNYARNVFHMTMGLTAVLLYEYVLSHRQASIVIVSLCATFLLLETVRRFLPSWNDFMVDRLFGAISRPWERHQINSSTYYTIGLVIVTLFFPKPVAQIAVLVLAFGDPMATLVGKRWGKRKVWNEKSYVGVGAFVLTSFVATTTFLLLVGGELTLGSKLSLALTVSLAGALAELVSERIDDNLTVPIFCAGIAYFWFPV